MAVGITDPFLDELDAAIAGGVAPVSEPIYPPSDFETISAGTIPSDSPAWSDPLRQGVNPIAGTLTTEDILTPSSGGKDTNSASSEDLGLVGWTFQGPFSKSQYDRIHNQNGIAMGGRTPYASQYGIRSRSPHSTPKYTRYLNLGHREGLETTARMYISVSKPASFIKSVAGTDKNLQGIASALVGGNTFEDSNRGYIDFLLQQATHSLSEKVQVVETLSDNYIAFFFGQSAPIFKYSGILMNSFQDDWAINMLRMYQSISRGSQLARRGVLFYLKYDSMIISGSILNLNWALNGDNELLVPFSFDLLVRKIHIIYGGLEPATAFWLDKSSTPSTGAFWPEGYDANESGSAGLRGKVFDDVGGDQPYGTGNTTSVTTKTAPAATPETGKSPPVTDPIPAATTADAYDVMGAMGI